jgi:type II secretory pathway pseudopilin PulG
MKVLKRPPKRGFLLLELALALVIIGGLMAVLVPLLAMQSKFDEASRDQQTMDSAVDALLRQAVVAGGLPAPLAFDSDGTASSHLDLADPLLALPPGWAGALPGNTLGVGSTSPLQTAYWYDVQPALRDDASKAFQIQVSPSGAPAFLPIYEQFDPDENPTLTTGGSATQLCRHVNTLLMLDHRIRQGLNGYNSAMINTTLPRVWATGQESRFAWNDSLGYSVLSSGNSTTHVMANSSIAAFVVVRRQPPALRRLDRQNAVYPIATGTFLDAAPDLVADPAYPGLALGGSRGFRVYENPLTRPRDDPGSDGSDYDGLVRSVSLQALAERLDNSGLCNAPAASCQAHELFVRFGNYVQSAPLAGSPQGLTMRWELLEQDPINTSTFTQVETGEVTSGSVSSGQCLGAFSTTLGNAPLTRYLRLSFISPTGTTGYSTGDYWHRSSVLVDPNASQPPPTADNGQTRWRNRDALSAANAGNTVTIQCTGSQSLNASNQLTTDSVPTCTASQLP